MAQDHRGGPKVQKPRDRDATLSFGVIEPRLDEIGFISPPLKLYSLKEHLSRFTLVKSSDSAGFNFENFVRNIRGIKYVELYGIEFEVLFTRTSVFLTFHGLPGKLKALENILGPEPLSRANLASSNDGSCITICRLTGRELRMLLGAVAVNASGTFKTDSLLPSETARDVDPAEFCKKLRQCSVVSSDGEFDLESFAKGVNIVSVFRNEEDAGYFIIGMVDDEAVYSLYVNVHAPGASERNPMIARLKYNNDSCALFRVDEIG
ncbi:MAG: hypothetical protein V1861_04940 [Candidatus Micrarchaeota archaeon]